MLHLATSNKRDVPTGDSLTVTPPSTKTAVLRKIMFGSKKTFHYFAYGSNLLTKRIHFQNPSAVFKDVAKLGGYKLEFRLPSKVKGSLFPNSF